MIFSAVIILVCSDICQSNAAQTLTILHTTDIHGWIYGHRHESSKNADAGDLYNFISHRKKNKAANEIVLAFDTGDMIEGTGLSEVNGSRGAEIYNIMKDIPYDAIVNGNHDIKYDKSVDHIVSSFAPAFGDRYLAGQAVYYNTSKTLGNPFKILNLDNGNGRVLLLGFTYNVANVQTHVKVTGVSAYLKQSWFARAMATTDVKAIICLCHINTDHTHLNNIHAAIRAKQPKTPIIFLTGHSHEERTKSFDSESFAMESGKYLNTIGILSFALPQKANKASSNFAELTEVNGGYASGIDLTSFSKRYLETNVGKMQKEVGVNSTAWATPVGSRIKANLKSRLNANGLLKQIGCAPQFYSNMEFPLPAISLYSLLVDKVYPKSGPKRADVLKLNADLSEHEIAGNGVNTVYIQDAKMRYNVYKGSMLLDDLYCVDPMGYDQHGILNVKGSHLKALWASSSPSTSTANSMSSPSSPLFLMDDDDRVPNAPFKEGRFMTKGGIKESEIYDVFMPLNVAAEAKQFLDTIAPGVYTIRQTGETSRSIFQKYIESTWKC
ncbi:putative Ser/Thr protein phosphatase family [Blattamonas nauphoetae]|uniref:Ser/Thr protein phosphatase family n=1 Tax=Blattamonas nauphoetae TaxID=2049346 RepID=A0ABQ9XB83_9EUKA|nr:putative Ser/Thr protein phosphatase family [Blattamonas nauphoetae]